MYGIRSSFCAMSLALLTPAMAADAPVYEPALPVIDVPHLSPTVSAPVIDGVLEDAAWNSAATVNSFTFPWWESGRKPHTIAQVTWDDRALFVAFKSQDRNVSARQAQRDDPVSRDDCVEVFFAPDSADVATYFNFEFNALGTILDRSPRDGRSGAWNAAGVEVAITVQGTLNDSTDVDQGWTAEIAIPFSDIAPYAPHLPPLPGDAWRLNLYRINDQSNRQYSLWSPTLTPKPQFHAPERFGIIRFVPATEMTKD